MNQRHTPASAPASPTLADASEPARIERVEAVLNLIALMPAEDPPENLVARTLERVRQAAMTPLAPSDDAALPLPTMVGRGDA